MDWIHCNLCYRQPTSKSTRFHLSNCGHIFCEDCQAQCKEQCKVCSKKCNLMPLVSPLKPSVALFFTEPCELHQRHQRELVQVMEFQKGHRQKLHAHLLEQLANYAQHASQQFAELENRYKQQYVEMESRHNQLTAELKQELQGRLQQIDHLKRAIQAGPPTPARATPSPACQSMAYLPRKEASASGNVTYHPHHVTIGASPAQQHQGQRQNSNTPVTGRLSICQPPVDVTERRMTPSTIPGKEQSDTSSQASHQPPSDYGHQTTASGVLKRMNPHDIQFAPHLMMDRSQRHHSPVCQRFSPFGPRTGSVNRLTPIITPTSQSRFHSGCPSSQDLRSYMASRLPPNLTPSTQR